MKKFILIAWIFLLAACNPVKTGKPTTITQDQKGQTITINANKSFIVTLPGNPTTGYTWEATDFDPQIIKADGNWTYQAESDKLGASGMVSLPFKAVSAGQTTLVLIYHRSFEKDVPPLETFSVTITVK